VDPAGDGGADASAAPDTGIGADPAADRADADPGTRRGED
jgi:hypothetical protein